MEQSPVRAFVREAGRVMFHPMTRHSGILLVCQYGSAALGLIGNIIVARLLGPSDYGVVVLAISFPSLVGSFVAAKSVSITIRYLSAFRTEGRYEELLGVAKFGYVVDLSVSLLCLILVGASAGVAARDIYQVPQMAGLAVVFALSFPFSALGGTSRAILTAWRRWSVLGVLQVVESSLDLLLSVVSLLLGFGPIGVIVGSASASAIVGIVMLFVAARTLKGDGLRPWWASPMKLGKGVAREISGFLGWNYLYVTLNGLVEEVPLLLLGRLRGSEQAGYYRLASNIVTVGSYIEGAMTKVAYPELSSRAVAEDPKSLRRSVIRWTWRAGLPASILTALSIPFLPYVIRLAFSTAYDPMVFGTQVMMIKSVIGVLLFWPTVFFYAAGKISLWVKSFLIYAVLLLGFGWLAVERAGFLGMVYVYLAVAGAFRIAMASLALRRKEAPQA